MRWCCPRGHGCNAPGGSEPCALDVCRAVTDEVSDAGQALERWNALQRACAYRRTDSERRFRRRAYERSRDRALMALAMHRGYALAGENGALVGEPVPPAGDQSGSADGRSARTRERPRKRRFSAQPLVS
jgi:hypothetical protein